MKIGKGNGDIALMGGRTCQILSVSWMKLNRRLHMLMESPYLHPDERSAGKENIYANEHLKGYAPLYPLPVIIALKVRKHIFSETVLHLYPYFGVFTVHFELTFISMEVIVASGEFYLIVERIGRGETVENAAIGHVYICKC